jgi:hypothetical protein
MVSGSISPPYSGYFSPFPHGTGSLSVSQEYLALPDGAGRFRRDFSGPALLRIPLGPENLRLTGLSPSMARLPSLFSFNFWSHGVVLQPRSCRDRAGLGSSAFARHYLRNHCCFLFLRVLRCFSSPGSPPLRVTILQIAGLPHSDTRGSHRMCRSPRLFAAYRVLLRL